MSSVQSRLARYDEAPLVPRNIPNFLPFRALQVASHAHAGRLLIRCSDQNGGTAATAGAARSS